MKRRRESGTDAKSYTEKYEALMAELEEVVIARNRYFDLDRCDMTLLIDIENQCAGDCELLKKSINDLKREIKKK